MYKRFPQIACLSSWVKKNQTTASYKVDRKKELRGRSRKPLKKNGILEKGEIRCDSYGIPCMEVVTWEVVSHGHHNCVKRVTHLVVTAQSTAEANSKQRFRTSFLWRKVTARARCLSVLRRSYQGKTQFIYRRNQQRKW